MVERTIRVRVSAGAKTERIEEVAPDMFKVRVQAPPEKGKANARVAQLIAKHFNVPTSSVFLAGGSTYREKVFIVETKRKP